MKEKERDVLGSDKVSEGSMLWHVFSSLEMLVLEQFCFFSFTFFPEKNGVYYSK